VKTVGKTYINRNFYARRIPFPLSERPVVDVLISRTRVFPFLKDSNNLAGGETGLSDLFTLGKCGNLKSPLVDNSDNQLYLQAVLAGHFIFV
jgi:hypothetical protein